MKERYNILKSIYPNYLIIFIKNNKTKLIGIDKEIINTFGYKNLKNVNKIIIDNLEIVKKEEYENNLYKLYYEKVRLINILRKVMS